MDTSQGVLLNWIFFLMEVRIKQLQNHVSFVFAALQMYVFYA